MAVYEICMKINRKHFILFCRRFWLLARSKFVVSDFISIGGRGSKEIEFGERAFEPIQQAGQLEVDLSVRRWQMAKFREKESETIPCNTHINRHGSRNGSEKIHHEKHNVKRCYWLSIAGGVWSEVVGFWISAAMEWLLSQNSVHYKVWQARAHWPETLVTPNEHLAVGGCK